MPTSFETHNATSASGPTIGRKLRTKILESVLLNRLTIIVGPTGCGKSTLVPSLLLDGLQGRICCTQPRRLAVVAIAKRVAQLQGVHLGGEKVGYHVGNQNRSSASTALVFTTAGVLLEELRASGVEALKRFKCLIIDECHERSPESDLILALSKEFMKAYPKAPIRLVLMSATFNHQRYKSYFQGVPGCDIVDTITLETAQSFIAWHQQVQTFYLDDMDKLLVNYDQHKSFLESTRRDPNHDLNHDAKSLSESLLRLIHSIVTHMDTIENKHQPFLIFCPTYRYLEQLYEKLAIINGRCTHLSVLHSAVDIEECIRTMYEIGRNHCERRIFLASAIADSSITVPDVALVIDLCRSLEVRWNVDERQHQPRTVWSSQSICNQRQGRTGRTCPGKVIRLVHQNFFISNLEQWDVCQLQISSCHNEVLAILCADSHRPDPVKFFASCLDPPPSQVVKDALLYLQQIGACIQSPLTKRWEPTIYGNVVASVPLSVGEARVVLEGARLGLLHEIVALMAIYLHKPSPIVHHFGDSMLNEVYMENFMPDVNPTEAASAALANLSTFMFWDVYWHQEQCENMTEMYRRRTLSRETADGMVLTVWHWSEELEQQHAAWCKQHDINPTSVRSIAETIESTMNVFFLERYNFDFLKCTNPTPIWRRKKDWADGSMDKKDMFSLIYGKEKSILLRDALKKLCGSKSALKALVDARRFHGQLKTGRVTSLKVDRPLACVPFFMGKCKYGSSCRNSHSQYARRPPCRFYQSGLCAKGVACLYAHEDSDEEDEIYTLSILQQLGGSSPLSISPLVPCIESLYIPEGPYQWYKANASKLFMLGEGNFKFSTSLAGECMSPRFASNFDSHVVLVSGATTYNKVDATRLHTDERVIKAVRTSGVRCLAWNFPFVADNGENSTIHESLLLCFFQSIALLCRETRTPLTVAITLQADQFSRWNVLRSIWRTGCELTGWCRFDYKMFPGYSPSRANGDKFPCDVPSFYLLEFPCHAQ